MADIGEEMQGLEKQNDTDLTIDKARDSIDQVDEKNENFTVKIDDENQPITMEEKQKILAKMKSTWRRKIVKF